MSTEVLVALVALGGVVAGAAITGVTMLLMAKGERSHEIRKRAEEANRARDAYQFETLLELQYASQRAMRATAAVYAQDYQHHQSTGARWRSKRVSEHWDRESIETVTALALLTPRVLNDGVRANAEKFRAAVSGVESAASEPAAFQLLQEAQVACIQLQGVVGEVVRSLPPPTSYRPMVTSPHADPKPASG